VCIPDHGGDYSKRNKSYIPQGEVESSFMFADASKKGEGV